MYVRRESFRAGLICACSIDKLKDILNARVVGISCGEIVHHMLLYNHIETPVVPLFFAIAALEKKCT